MQTIKVEAPAKINLTLEVLDKRADGFHNIKSIMQTISLYDYITASVTDYDGINIKISGNSTEIPYDEKNLVYKAIIKFVEKTKIQNKSFNVYIEKNIPVEAGLAGGSTDAAAMFLALNTLFNNILTNDELNELCATLGSDLNFCLQGGTALCTGRGEIIKKSKPINSPVSLVKPIGLGISAKEAYTKFAQLSDKTVPNNTEKLEVAFDKTLLYNSLENAVIDDYAQLQEIKSKETESLMSGSGPTFFTLKEKLTNKFPKEKFLTIENLQFVEHGVRIVN